MTPLLAATLALLPVSLGLNVWVLLSLRRNARSINALQRERREVAGLPTTIVN